MTDRFRPRWSRRWPERDGTRVSYDDDDKTGELGKKNMSENPSALALNSRSVAAAVALKIVYF